MVIKAINIPRGMFVELKKQSPIPAYFNRPITFHFAGQLVQSKARKIHVVGFMGGVQSA